MQGRIQRGKKDDLHTESCGEGPQSKSIAWLLLKRLLHVGLLVLSMPSKCDDHQYGCLGSQKEVAMRSFFRSGRYIKAAHAIVQRRGLGDDYHSSRSDSAVEGSGEKVAML